MQDIKLIDYDHCSDDTLCNGVITSEEPHRGAEATWVYDFEGHQRMRTTGVAQATVQALWDAMARSLACHGLFSRCLVVDPTRRLDPEAFHLIVAVVEQGNRTHGYTFAVPVGEDGPEFSEWMRLLDPPHTAPALLMAS